MSKTAVIYTRVSTEEQGRKYGPLFQEREARDYALRTGLTVVEVIRDEVSGATNLDERPGGRHLIDMAAAGQVEAVVVWQLDRLARPPEEERSRLLTTAEQLARWHVELHEVEHGRIDVRDTLGVVLLMLKSSAATDERTRIGQRSKKGRREKALRGNWVGAGGAPYGYRQAWRDGELELEPDPEQAPIVQELFRLYGSGAQTLSGLVRWLNERNVPAPRGDTWHYSTLRLRILGRRVYLGEFEYAGIVINRPDLALVTEAQWQAVQERFESNKARARRHQKYDYLLSGHFRCGRCGRIMRGYANKAGRLRYYGCRYAVYPGGECDQPRFRADAVEEATWREVHGFLDNPAAIAEKLALLRDQQRAELLPTEERIKAIDGLLTKTRRRKQAQLRALGVLGDDEDILAALQQLKEQEQSLQRERAGLESKLAQGVLSAEDEQKLQASLALIRGELGRADYEERRQLFRFLDLVVEVDGEEFTATCSLGEIAGYRIDSIPSRR